MLCVLSATLVVLSIINLFLAIYQYKRVKILKFLIKNMIKDIRKDDKK